MLAAIFIGYLFVNRRVLRVAEGPPVALRAGMCGAAEMG